MKKPILLFFILHCGSLIINAQNLIQNFSFEDTIHCPTGYSQSTYAQGWTININSADYFNACSNNPFFSTPNANFGYQCPANGNAYCGFIAYTDYNPAYNEFLGCQLTSPLIIGQKYYFTFKVSSVWNCGVDKLGIVFTNVFYGATQISHPAFNLTGLKIYYPLVVTDTTNWVTIKGSFYPDSAYNYVLFGNLGDTNNPNNFICFDTTISTISYYYIDDVCVSTDSLTCEIPNGPNICDTSVNISETILNKELYVIYPNPTNGQILINLPFINEATINIYNLLGQLILVKSFSDKTIVIDLSGLERGMYIIQIKQLNKIFNKKIIIANL